MPSSIAAQTIPLPAPRVDAHAHIYALDMPERGTAWHKPPQDASIERYLATLDAHGIEFAVLAASSLHGDYNDYSIGACCRHPRLRTTVIVDPAVDPYILRQMKCDGVVGVRFQWRNVTPPDLTTYEYRRLLHRIADLDWQVQLHDDSPRLPGAIAAIQASGAKLVVDHFGRPDAALGVNCPGFQAVLKAIENGRTWVKLASGFRLASAALATACAHELLKVAGPERLVWGSDWPFAAFESTVTYEQTLASFIDWVPDPDARRIIGGETPLALYFS